MIQAQARADYRVIALAYLTFIALGLPGGLLGVAWLSVRDTFEVPTSSLGILLLATTAGYLTASFFNGRIITKLGIGPALLLASLFSAVGVLGYALAQGWWLMVSIGIVLGIGQGIIDAAMNLYFANHYGPRLMNWLHASFGLGAALGPLIMTGLFSLGQPWRWGYLILAFIQLALAALFFMTLNRWQANPTDETIANIETPPMLDTLKRPLVWMSIALFFVFVGIETVAGNWGFVLLTESRSIDRVTAGQWVSLYWWSFTLGRILFGFIADRLPVTLTIRACMLLILAGSVLLTANIGPTITFIGLAVVGFAQAPIFPLLITATPQRLGANHASNAIGFQIAAAGLSIAGLPAIAGYLAEQTSIEIIGPFLIVVSIAAFTLFHFLSARDSSTIDAEKRNVR